ncbi:MAG: 2Fe-2S iron-sulfur cluster binding domain-containing protein [Myxococcales bacterium]|nr:2Fe-2S iron-sulfur cluster binding domain-containing protein [Myxococcales bacterium]
MSYAIQLLPFDISFDCEEEETILDAALRQGINLRYGCKHGGCGSCKAQIAEGEVDVGEASTFALMDYEQNQGLALLCSAYPLSDVAIELADDYEEAELRSGVPIREFEAGVEALAPLTHDIWQLRLALRKPSSMTFEAGQYVEIQVPGTDSWRAFSMSNAPSDEGRVELMIKLLPGGLFSGFLSERLAVGDALKLRGPFGRFVLAETEAPIIMVAGGAGLAPIAAMLRALAERNSQRSITFFYGARTTRDLFWLEELEALAGQLESFEFIPALSEPGAADVWDGEVGLVTEVVDRRCEKLRAAEAYLCGPPAMIDAAIEVLRAKGLFSARIRYDKFVSTED